MNQWYHFISKTEDNLHIKQNNNKIITLKTFFGIFNS